MWPFKKKPKEPLYHPEVEVEVILENCVHECPTCTYFNGVHRITESRKLKDDVIGLKIQHLDECDGPNPTSSSCYHFHRTADTQN